MADNPAAPPESLEMLFLAEESRMLHFATGLTGNFAVGQDIVQEAFIRLHNAGNSVVHPRAWLFRTIRNLASNHRRSNVRHDSLDEHHELFPDDTAVPADELERTERILLMRLCLDDLPPADRELVRLKFEQELSYDEIASRTGFTSGNVGYRLHHALKRLAAAFHRAGDKAQLQTQQP
ncbi:MAG: sigma-70 family RNA polymerase sigma factor [Puniceicoccales bacterium]|jgi:RNA polymerase sigma-70 factor (ECF subfamily)|nr:sigma-70 family RNA polymerase sigma factor [Puniceicoccales bacterium]